MPASDSPSKTGGAVVWALRLVWISLAAAGPLAFADALDGRLGAVRWTATIELWLGWFVTLVALLVPGVVPLTLLRLIIPAAPFAAAAALVAGGDAAPGVTMACLGLGAVTLAFGAETGQHFIQGSAYGDELRFPLRPPGPLLLGPIELLWLCSIGPTLAGPLLCAAGFVAAGASATLAGAAALWGLAPRFHQLARRWLVFVPAGLVVHDHLPLAETVMIPAADLDVLNLAPADTTATDLTAQALGPAVEIRLHRPLAITRRGVGRSAPSTAAATDALLVSPSRPGRVIAAARARNW